MRAQILIAQDNTAEAAKAAEKVLDYGLEKVKSVLALTEELYTEQAKTIYLKVVGKGSKEILPYLSLGTIALHGKELTEAERWLRQTEKIQPKHAALLLALGRLESARGNYSKAVLLLEESREKGEESATLYSELGESRYQLKEWQKADEAFERALKRQRRNTRWRLFRAHSLVQLGRFKEAELKYREVLALDPNSSEGWMGLKSLGKRY